MIPWSVGLRLSGTEVHLNCLLTQCESSHKEIIKLTLCQAKSEIERDGQRVDRQIDMLCRQVDTQVDRQTVRHADR